MSPQDRAKLVIRQDSRPSATYQAQLQVVQNSKVCETQQRTLMWTVLLAIAAVPLAVATLVLTIFAIG